MKDIKFVFADDWTGLYVDGKLKYQNHSIDERKLLELLGIEFSSIYVEDYAEDLSAFGNTLPVNIADFNLEFDITT